ncbi:MAG: aspartyl-tRNA(Asn)/glutamyl-tRNA(Gln) amidotransferase subunit A [Hyphomicrobiaceae bacterium]|jgi:aspartyl-tRNA(Asn)/glutamyl-tRNA(Gln) amidotransferase subunit A
MSMKPTGGDTETSVRNVLEGIRSHEPRLQAVVSMLDDTAIADAQHQDELAATGATAGVLHGLPIVVKDIIDLAGQPTRSGSLTRADNPPCDADAPVVAALRGAGAIPVAKTNTVEFAIGGWGTNETVGTPVNPWDLDTHRVPGGSSSGTGVLVGGGIVPTGLGTDTGGSVRIPAAFCGCVGLKTSIGLVSRAGVTPLSTTLDTIGPLTNSVKLAARMLAVMQGPDRADPTTLGVVAGCPLRDLDLGIQGLRLARIRNEHMPHLTKEVAEAFDVALNQLREAGATITEVELPLPLDDYQHLGGVISATEAYATYADLVDNPNSHMAAPNRTRMASGAKVTAAELIRIQRDRTRSIAEFETVIDRADAIILPTAPITAIPVADVDETDMRMSSHTRFGNYLELAGLAVPMNLSSDGLPTSLQIVVRRFDDPLALRIGAAFEKVRGPFAPPRLG